MIDEKIKELLKKQAESVAPISDKIVKKLKNPRYTSGKLIKFGDIILHILEVKSDLEKSHIQKTYDGRSMLVPNEQRGEFFEMQLSIIILEENEIDYYSKNYLFSYGDEKSIHVIKRPE